MDKQWLLLTVITALLAAGLGCLKLFEYRKLKRMRALNCPNCHSPFAVTSLSAVKRWMDFDIESGSKKASGFYLHCDRCAADYRFLEDCRLLGRAEQKT
jgi:hypothetical protein